MRTMKGTKGGQKDWLKGGGEDAWGWRGRVVETVACGTMRCSFLRFFFRGGREMLWENCKCFFFLFSFKDG